MLISRILMNAQDGSPGSGAPSTPATPATPADPAAPVPQQAPAQGSAIDVAAITRTITESVTKSINDGVFAKLRRAGLLSDKPTTTVAVTSDTTTTASSSAISAADVQGMIEQASAITRVSVEYGLQPDAESSLKRLMAVEKPDDPVSWGRSFVEGMGIKKVAPALATAAPQATTQPATAAQAATPPSTAPQSPPASDRGSPPAATIPLEERKLQEMSDADRSEYLQRHGVKKYSEKLARDLVGSKVW